MIRSLRFTSIFFMRCFSSLVCLVLLILSGVSLCCRAEQEKVPGFRLVTSKKDYPQRTWQVPPAFFESDAPVNRGFLISFFKAKGVSLSKKCSVSYLKNENQLLLADTQKKTDRVHALVEQYAKSVASSSALPPEVKCGEIVDGTLREIPYPKSLFADFISELNFISGRPPKRPRAYYFVPVEYNDSDVDDDFFPGRKKKSGKKAVSASRLKSLKKQVKVFENRDDVACIIVLKEKVSRSHLPEHWSVPVISGKKLKDSIRRVLIKHKVLKKSSSSDFADEEFDSGVDIKTSRGVFLSGLWEMYSHDSDFGSGVISAECLFTYYGYRVEGVNLENEGILEYLKELDKSAP